MSVEGAAERPSRVLKREHQVILRVIAVLEGLLDRQAAGEPPEVEALADCVTFFRLFADACHHAKEEDLLFPGLEQRGVPRDGGPIGVMLSEHRVARQLVGSMAAALERLPRDPSAAHDVESAGRDYIELLRQHILKEDNVLFAIGDQVMSEDDQSTLAKSFCEVGCRAFEGKRREEFERLAAELEERWSTDS
ncbi:MAG: hemerythrin domain-containing protein [Thermoanaerobaculia bacterium]|nr:hemerythrin domain-containing protein [Thermoanaerobaculia bacterium]